MLQPSSSRSANPASSSVASRRPAVAGGRSVTRASSAVVTPRGKRSIARSSAMAFVSDWVRGTLIS